MKHSLTHDRFRGFGEEPFDQSSGRLTRSGDLRQYSEICINKTRGRLYVQQEP